MSLSMKINELVEKLGERVVGNKEVKQAIAVTIRHRYLASRLARQGAVLQPTNLLIFGESGSGKTEVIKALSEIIGIPILSFTATSFSETGYKGQDISEIPKRVMQEIDKVITRDYKGGRGSGASTEMTALMRSLMQHSDTPQSTHNKTDYKTYLKDNPIIAICFIDEIDKLIGTDKDMVSRMGVQRSLLGVISGEALDQHGVLNTANILWVAAGAFHETNPGRLLPELLGRLNVQVGTDHVTEEAMYQALKNPKTSPIENWLKVLKEDGINVKVDESGLKALAEACAWMNTYEPPSIGFRRLPAVCNRIFRDIMINPPAEGTKVVINKDWVDKLDLKKIPF